MSVISRLMIMIAILFSPATLAQADESDPFASTFYGSFIHFGAVPNALFFFDAIEDQDTLQFRKALRNHEVDTIVLASPGGKVFEGLQMAGIIYDRKITTYVPKSQDCVSACAFMFFAGDLKVASGKLGVHQFSADEEARKKEAPVGVSDFISQYTVSEIIGFLNEFETPPFVFERMFETRPDEMYYFSPDELQKFEKANKPKASAPLKWEWDEDSKKLVPNISENKNLTSIETFLAKLSTALKEEACDEDVAKCSPEQLCARAAENNLWVENQSKVKFVGEAKRRGLSCDVVEKTTTCISDPKMCSTAELCSEVTMSKNGIKIWRTDPSIQSYLSETRRRGLECEVSGNIPTASTLAIYTEDKDYRVGDAIRLFIEPQRQCRLTLINIDDDGDSCVMFPHPDLDDKPIAAGSTFVFPPKGSLRFSEVGVETVIAVCNFSRAAINAELRDTSKVSCDKSQLVYAEAKIEEAAILETFTFDANDSDTALTGVADNTDLNSENRTIVKAQISIPVGAK
jgi:hypothetical protein